MLRELEGLGVELRAAGDDLEYEGPEEALTLELLERLKAYKADLVWELSVGNSFQPSTEVCRLEAAGFRPKVSFFERVIWQRPDTGFYVSEQMALHLLNRDGVKVGSKQ